ncbi:MAG: hypothetical protein F4Y38_15225 [Gemmatimonadetes bacterium]|nr:hypothetical protein [Gemmatimonadota bacterium]MYG83786.1 hypothetical protein [Gemmatimonadota bacterium]MYJ90617.1 hypothetical protein [Gemmatimonadota bacterium]
MTHERISQLAGRIGDYLRGNRIVGLSLPDVSPEACPWSAVNAPGSWAPFEAVYRAGPVLLPCLGSAMDAERRIDAVRVLRMLRAESLLSAFGCSALNLGCEAGSFVIVDDHVNCTGENPLRGPNDERLGPRYPDMSAPYDARWSNGLKRGAASLGLELRGVVYGRVARSGSCDELAAWVRAGIDVVGEGLLDEVITAAHCGLPVAAVGVIEKSLTVDGKVLCSSILARSEDYGRLAAIIDHCLLCRGGMDDG